nr:venom polypeptide precursor [Doratifera vulnerans]
MLKSIIFGCFLTFALVSSNSLEKFYGEWFMVANFRNVIDFPVCGKFTVFDGEGKVKCNCNGAEKEVALIRAETSGIEGSEKFVVIPVDSVEEITPTLHCNCGKYEPVLHWYKANDNYLIGYEIQKGAVYKENEPSTAYIATRHEPTLTEVKNFIAGRADLKDREVEFACDKLRP